MACLLKLLSVFTVLLEMSQFSPMLAVSASRILSIGEKCGKSETNLQLDIADNGSVIDSEICDPKMPLECVDNFCTCKRGFTINRNGTKCLEIARNGLESVCEESIQCWRGLLGRLSECKENKCQCYESETLPIIFHRGRCYYGESLGEFCQIDGLCEATVPNAECRTTCQCSEGYIPSWDKSRCLQIAVDGLNSSCEENVQCEKSPLGSLSQCDLETMKCQCYQIPMLPTVFYGGRCYIAAALNDVCQVDLQCRAKTEHSKCGKDGKCYCRENYVPNKNSSKCLQIPSADGSSQINQFECVEDIQCSKSLGHFARCNLATRRCECYIPNAGQNETTTTTAFSVTTTEEEPVTSMVIIGSKCHSAKYLGQPCKFNKQCSSTTENSICYNALCECREETHVPSSDGRKCLEIGKNGLNSNCDEDIQCIHSLGPLSRCNVGKGKCECSNILPVVYYDKKCYFHRSLGQPCENHADCKAGGNFLAECLQGKCQCKSGSKKFSDHSCIHIPNSGCSSCLGNVLIAILCVHLFLALVK